MQMNQTPISSAELRRPADSCWTLRTARSSGNLLQAHRHGHGYVRHRAMDMHARSAMLHLEHVGAAAHELHAEDPQGQQGETAEATGAPHGVAGREAESAEQPPAADLALQLPGGRTLAAFMGLWDQLTARLLPRNATGASADTLLAAIQLLMAANAAQPSPTQPLQGNQRQLQQAQQQQQHWQLPNQTPADLQPDPVQPVPTPDASAAALHPRAAAAAAAAISDASAQQQDAPVITGQLLAVALQLADLSAGGIPLDAEAIAAGVLAEAVVSEQLSMDAVQAKLGTPMVRLLSEVAAVHALSDVVDVYDDSTSSALRELALRVYDRRAIVVEVVSRLHALQAATAGSRPQHELQVLALEALQLYAPMGHAMGLGQLSSSIEDICFQILFPASYSETAAWLRKAAISNEGTLRQCISQLQAALGANAHLRTLTAGVQLHGRTKSLFSAMRKILRLGDMAAGGRRLEQLHDLLGLRAIVQPRADLPEAQARLAAVEACYIVNDAVRELWPEVDGRSKDYILNPKANQYQSLHITMEVPAVLLDMETTDSSEAAGVTKAQPERIVDHSPNMEIQIRTQDMHERAELGEAAHTAYKGRLESWQHDQLQAWTATVPTDVPLATHATRKQRAQAAAVELFRHLDTNGDGKLSREEVQHMIAALAPGGGGDAAAAQEVMDTIADPQTGSIDFSGFLHFFSMLEGLLAPRPSAAAVGSSHAVPLLAAPGSTLHLGAPAVMDRPGSASSRAGHPLSPTAGSPSQPLVAAPPSHRSAAPSHSDAGTKRSGGVLRGAVRVLAAHVAKPAPGLEDDVSAGGWQHSRVAARRHQQADGGRATQYLCRVPGVESVSHPAMPDPLRRELPDTDQRQLSGGAQPATLCWDEPGDPHGHSGDTAAAVAAAAATDAEPGPLLNGHAMGEQPPARQLAAQQGHTASATAEFHSAAGVKQSARSDVQQQAMPATASEAVPGGKRRPLRRRRAPGSVTMTLDLPLAGLQPQPLRRLKFRGGRKATKRLRLMVQDPAGGTWCSSTGQPLVHSGLQLPHVGPVVIGSDSAQDCDVVADAPGISGRHARLEVVRRGKQLSCLLTDLGSRHGTWHNGSRLKPFDDVRLRANDTVELGTAPRSAEGSRTAGSSGDAAGQAAAGGQHRQRRAVIALAGADMQPPLRATAAALRQLPRAEHQGARLSGVIMDSGRVVYLDVAARAAQLSRDHDFAAARALLQRHLASSPRNGALWSQLANLERRAAKGREAGASASAARAYYRAAVEQLAAAGGGSLVSVDASLASVDDAVGAAAAAALPEHVSSLTRALDSWAQMEYKLGHHTAGRRLFMRSVAAAHATSDPAIHTHVTWARQEMRLGNHALVRELLGKVLGADPRHHKALHLLAVVEARGNNAAKLRARELWRRACQVEPHNVVALQAWGRMEGKLCHLGEARRLFEKAAELEPFNEYVLQAWAVAETENGNSDQARALFQRATEAQPESVPAWQAWAVMEGDAGNTDRARELFHRALSVKANPQTLSAMATMERRCSNFTEARMLLQQALELNPAHPPALLEQKLVEEASKSAAVSAKQQ